MCEARSFIDSSIPTAVTNSTERVTGLDMLESHKTPNTGKFHFVRGENYCKQIQGKTSRRLITDKQPQPNSCEPTIKTAGTCTAYDLKRTGEPCKAKHLGRWEPSRHLSVSREDW